MNVEHEVVELRRALHTLTTTVARLEERLRPLERLMYALVGTSLMAVLVALLATVVKR